MDRREPNNLWMVSDVAISVQFLKSECQSQTVRLWETFSMVGRALVRTGMSGYIVLYTGFQ